MKMTSLLIACGLALAPAACKKDKDDGVPSPKSVENAEKEAMEAKDEVKEQMKDVTKEVEDVAEEANDVGPASADFAKERDEFVAKAKARMSTLDARMDALKADLKANGARIKGETRAEMDELMKDIAEEQAKAKAAFQAASTGAKDRWDDLEKNTGEALEDLSDKTDSLAEKMKDAGIKLRAKAEAADK
jgi:hypothetical protein